MLSEGSKKTEMKEPTQHNKPIIAPPAPKSGFELKIAQWLEAYPEDIFPEIDYQSLREILDPHNISIERVYASIARDILKKVIKLIDS